MNFLVSKKAYLATLVVIFFISAFIRLFQLDQVPAGMSWDEAAIGYNGFAVWKVHRDEWAHFMPISFQSFGDYKAPFAIYATGFFTFLFGLNIFSVRLPFALAGIFTVIGVAFLIEEIFHFFVKKNNDNDTLVLKRFTVVVTTFMFALSPWHMFFSRQGFESGMALFWIVWGVNALLWSFKFEHKLKLFFIVCCSLSFAISLYTYHSAKIFVPLFATLLLVIFFKSISKHFKKYIFGVVIGILFLLPLVYDSVWGKGATRLSQTSVFGKESFSISQKLFTIVQNYFAHFSPRFLLQGETTTLRHGDGKWGVLFFTELILVVFTIAYIVDKRAQSKQNKTEHTSLFKLFILGMGWILIGIVPASIGFEIPHANRALLSYPGVSILEAVAIFVLSQKLYRFKDSTKTFRSHTSALFIQSCLGMLVLIEVLYFLTFFHSYMTQYKQDSIEAFNYGYKEVFDEVIKLEPEVDKIMFTSKYGQPYIYAIFYRNTNPLEYVHGSLAKYEFPDNINVGDLIRKNALIVATPEEMSPALADTLIVAPNGQVRFVIIRTEN